MHMAAGADMKRFILLIAVFTQLLCAGSFTQADPIKVNSIQTASLTNVNKTSPERIILDTDIGDDIDDAFALALSLSSHEIELMGVTTAWGDTGLRARLVERFLCETGNMDVPVFAGVQTTSKTNFTQRGWAREYSASKHQPSAAGVDFILNTVRRYPGRITLIAIAPLNNVGALIDKDPATFRKLKKVVLMGGSIRRGYGDIGSATSPGPSAEYNIQMDVSSANKLLASGVPIFMLPLDSTQLQLDAARRKRIFEKNTPLTHVLMQLYSEWSAATKRTTPVLFDAMAVAYDLDPGLCPMTQIRLHVDNGGYTRVIAGTPNVNVCLQSDPDKFFSFYMPRILNAKVKSSAGGFSCTGNPAVR